MSAIYNQKKYVCPHGSDIPIEADFAVSVVAMTDEAIADVDKHLLKMTETVRDIGGNGVPIKLSKDVYDCLKRRLDTKLHHLYGVARTAAKRVHKDLKKIGIITFGEIDNNVN